MPKPQTYSIVLGDTFLIRYKIYRKPDLKAYAGTSEGDPITPHRAFVRLVNFEAGVQVPLGDGVTGVEGNATVDGNEVRYLIPAEKLAQPGRYRAFTRIELPDGQLKTQTVQFTVVDLS